jgi:hypothetical protein
VNSQHLDCRINETKSEVCDLVYTAITGMQCVCVIRSVCPSVLNFNSPKLIALEN